DNSLAFHPGPNPSRQSVSKGSVDHGSGACRPCAWLYKSRNGCRHGEKCDYCHMCPPGELKRKKRDKLARRAEEMRQQRLQAPLPRLSGPPPPPFDADATLGPEFSAAFCTPTLAAIGAPAALDVVIPVHDKDTATLALTVRSLRNCCPEVRRILVVSRTPWDDPAVA
ncbi:unnamed protein product, partial [Polarella glacialis]